LRHSKEPGTHRESNGAERKARRFQAQLKAQAVVPDPMESRKEAKWNGLPAAETGRVPAEAAIRV